MKQYHDLVKHVLENSNQKATMPGTNLKCVWLQMRFFFFDLSEGFPMVTTKTHLNRLFMNCCGF